MNRIRREWLKHGNPPGDFHEGPALWRQEPPGPTLPVPSRPREAALPASTAASAPARARLKGLSVSANRGETRVVFAGREGAAATLSGGTAGADGGAGSCEMTRPERYGQQLLQFIAQLERRPEPGSPTVLPWLEAARRHLDCPPAARREETRGTAWPRRSAVSALGATSCAHPDRDLSTA